MTITNLTITYDARRDKGDEHLLYWEECGADICGYTQMRQATLLTGTRQEVQDEWLKWHQFLLKNPIFR